MSKHTKMNISTIKCAVISTLIASALWEKIFSPLIDFVFSKITTLLTFSNFKYSNNVYKKIASLAFTEPKTINIFIIVFIYLYTIVLIYFSVRVIFLICKNKEFMNRRHFLSLTNISCFLFLIAIFLFYTGGEQRYIISCSKKTSLSIEMLSPHISDTEYSNLKSRLCAIETKSDYDSLIIDLKEIAERENIKLPK